MIDNQTENLTEGVAGVPESGHQQTQKRHSVYQQGMQYNIIKLLKHSDLLNALIRLDNDIAREYVTMMGQVGVGKLTDEQESEIDNFINTLTKAG